MLHSLLSKKGGLQSADAHCDIPCKIYDPATMIISALTVVRMNDIIDELQASGAAQDKAYLNTFARAVAQKEEHAEEVKREVRVIWGDYFKAPQMEAYPEIHDLAHGIMMKAGAAKQNADRAIAVELVDMVNRFAEIFWATKDVKTKKATCPYPPSLEVVYPDL